jgi:hypothetical protein
MSRNTANGSVELEQVREQLAHWRRTPGRGRAMPEEIWESVVALAKVHGLNPIVR